MKDVKKDEVQDIYNNLTEENKDVLNLVAKSMQVAQLNKEGVLKND